MPDHDLELALAGLGRELSFPATPDLVAAVARRLESARQPRRSRGRVLVLAFAILLATAGVAAGVTAGLRGLGIAFVHHLPAATPGKGLDLGLQVQLSEARQLAGFSLVVPGPPLGAPDAWFVGNVGNGRAVSLVWQHRAGLPPAQKGVSILATESVGEIDLGFAKQLFIKRTKVEFVTIDGGQGVWIFGAPHILQFLSGTGALRHVERRLVGNVLAWNRGNLLIRIEGARTLSEARRLAASFSRKHGTG